MSDTTITTLMKELLEVDEKTWNVIYLRIMRISGIMPEDDEGQDIIHGCIQRAIAAHPDWIMFQWRRAGKWRTSIRRGLSGYSDPEYMHIVENDTPAAAILAAYIEAVRASK